MRGGEDLAKILGYTQDREVASLTEEQKMEIREEVSRILERSGLGPSAERGPGIIDIMEDLRSIHRTVALPNPPYTQPLEPLVHVISRAVEVLGSSEKVLRWLSAPVRSLGDQAPVSLLSTPEGIARVEDALGRIEHGVW